MNKIKRRIEYILKHHLLIQKLYKVIFSQIFKLMGIFIKTDQKLILFNGLEKKFNDSPREIFNYIVDTGMNKNYKLVWALDEPERYDIPQAEKIKMDTLKYFITVLKAKYWVSCVNIERGLNIKKKQTIYLNTWHGTPLKFIGNAVNKRNDFDFSNIDLFSYSGSYEKKIFKRDFNVPEKNLLFSGLPRNDELYNVTNKNIESYKEYFNIPKDKKVILYAPTWRNSTDKGENYSIEPPLDITYLQKELQSEYVLLIRAHSHTNEVLGINFNEFVRDFSSYPEINDLLILADILISDYSSTIFDYSILEKPIICFGYDLKQYYFDRGVYIDLERELPSGVMKTQEEVVYKIKTMDYADECKKTSQFKNKYIETGGNATEKCVEKLLK